MKVFALLALALVFGSTAYANPAEDAIAIAAGSSVDVGGFLSDRDFNGGATSYSGIPIDRGGVEDAGPEELYRSARFGNFSYLLPGLEAGVLYKIRLHFAETYWEESGKRVFNVSVSNASTPVLQNFDIFAAAGGKGVAVVREFTAEANNLGNILLQFTSLVDNAQVNGIEVQRATPVPPQPTPGYNLSLGADKANYLAGQSASVMVSLYNLPENPRYEFYVSAAFNGAALPLTRITDTQLYAVTPAMAAGASTVVASLFLQDKNEAAALEQSVAYYASEISRLTDELGQASSPEEIAAIQAEITRDQASLDAAQDHLNHVRTPIGAPVSITLTAQ